MLKGVNNSKNVKKVITLNPTNIDLYSLLVENKKEDKDSLRIRARIRDRLGVGPLSMTTIQDMLKGVKDAQADSYF